MVDPPDPLIYLRRWLDVRPAPLGEFLWRAHDPAMMLTHQTAWMAVTLDLLKRLDRPHGH